MKFQIEKRLFEEKLALSSHFSSSKISSLQTIQGALLCAKDGFISITTTNLNDFYYTKIKTVVDEEGEVVFDHKKAQEFISLLGQGDIKISLEEKSIVICQDKNKGYFKTYPQEDFPEKPTTQGEEIKLDKKTTNTLNLVLFSASRDETRPALTGVYFGRKAGEREIVTTDGFRLSLLRVPSEKEEKKEKGGILLPASVLGEMLKQSKKTEGTKLFFDEKERVVRFDMEETTLFSRVI